MQVRRERVHGVRRTALALLVTSLGCSSGLSLDEDADDAGAGVREREGTKVQPSPSLDATLPGEDAGEAPDASVPEPPAPEDAGSARCDPSAPFGEAVPLDALNTPAHDSDAFLTDDELTLYFASGGPANSDLRVATRASVDDDFSAPTPLPGLVNTTFKEARPTLSADGLTLYYQSNASGQNHIFAAARPTRTASFSAGAPVAVINEASAVDSAPSLSRDGETLYFSSTRSGVGDLYVAERQGDTFRAPGVVNVNDPEASDDAPVISADGLTLYFASTRADPSAQGNSDIWVATRASLTDGFSTPVNVRELNTLVSDEPNAISADGCVLYFTRWDTSTASGARDLYVATRGR